MRALAVLLYTLGGVSQGMTARLLGVSHVAVHEWVRAAGEAAPTPPTASSEGVVQIDEIWHFVNGKKQGSALIGFRGGEDRPVRPGRRRGCRGAPSRGTGRRGRAGRSRDRRAASPARRPGAAGAGSAAAARSLRPCRRGP